MSDKYLTGGLAAGRHSVRDTAAPKVFGAVKTRRITRFKSRPMLHAHPRQLEGYMYSTTAALAGAGVLSSCMAVVV